MGRPSSTWCAIWGVCSPRWRSHHGTTSASNHRWSSRRTAGAWPVRVSLRQASRGKIPVVVLLSVALIIVPVISLIVVILVLVVLLVVLLRSRPGGPGSVLALGWRPWCSRPVEGTRGGVPSVVSHLCVDLFLRYSRDLSFPVCRLLEIRDPLQSFAT